MLPSDDATRKAMASTLKARDFIVIDVPELDWFLNNENVAQYKWDRDFDTYCNKPFVGLHTSGSTGIPKKIVISHGVYISGDHAFAKELEMSEQAFPKLWAGSRYFFQFPFFHAAGIFNLVLAMLSDVETIIIAPPAPFTGDITTAVLKATRPTIAGIPPAVLADMAANPEQVKTLGNCSNVLFGGGPLPNEAGREIAKHTKIQNLIGASETGMMYMHEVSNDDLLCFSFLDIVGADFRHHTDDLYEMVLVRTPEREKYQSVFYNFPDLQEYHTKDLFQKHPTKEGLWTWQGRIDDIIAYSTGEKFNPTTMQDILDGHPDIKSAVVCGQERFQSSLLLEPAKELKTEEEKQKLIDSLWPSIVKANAESPNYARLQRDMIVIVDSQKPLPRAGKGSVQKVLAERLYKQELDAVYDAVDDFDVYHKRDSKLSDDTSGKRNELVEKVIEMIAQDTPLHKVGSGDNLFDLGLDSLGALTMARKLRRLAAERGLRQDIPPAEIYKNPTVSGIVSSMLGATSGNAPAEDGPEVSQELYEQYTEDLPITGRAPELDPYAKKIVLLTGSTGSLGSYILDDLINDQTVAEIVCFNRSDRARDRHIESAKQRGLHGSLDAKPISFHEVDFAKPRFGLSTSVYRSLLGKVTIIIHNAWQVDFNISLRQMAKTHVHGVREFIDFASRSKHDASIFFISSIAATTGPDYATADLIEERLNEKWTAALPSGYGQSKLLAERLLIAAADQSGTRCAICRVGQVAGPSVAAGSWNETEWLPSLVFSSRYLGVVPETIGAAERVSWTPVDKAAKSVVELALAPMSEEQDAPAVYHMDNPHSTTWSKLRPEVEIVLGVPAVPYTEWLQKLESSDLSTGKENPAVKLMDYFRSINTDRAMPVHDTTQAKSKSETMASLHAVDASLMRNWLTQWGLSSRWHA